MKIFTEKTDNAIDHADLKPFQAEEVFELEYDDLKPLFGDLVFADTSMCAPRSFASLQLRAKNAVKTLVASKIRQVMVLCASSGIDQIDTACDLLSEVGLAAYAKAYSPKSKDFFGDKNKRNGLIWSSSILVMPCSHLIDHPKWLNRIDGILSLNKSLKLILCGDAADCAQLQLMWPSLDNALHADIMSEFSSSVGIDLLAGLASSYAERFGLRPFSADAIKLLGCYAARLSGDKRWFGITELKLKYLMFEASSFAKGGVVGGYEVLKAIGADDFRNNYLAELELRNHRDRQILISTSGRVVGQINGMSVIETSGSSYEYGEPVRITATLRAGGEGDVIDIERKAELAGQIHAKAMMIINGFLTKEFGSELPLPVSASLVFEQSYSEIDGDSASLTGLCAVISAFADLPIRQDLAVTGAVDQFGDVQPVGGVNEKIEGFFRICRLNGFTGTQGVVIPVSCTNQLVLRPAVARAVKEGKFHIYAVNHVTAAVKILMSVPWGDADDEHSVCGRICRRLDEVGSGKNVKPWWRFW